jgi:hypothetical protein
MIPLLSAEGTSKLQSLATDMDMGYVKVQIRFQERESMYSSGK